MKIFEGNITSVGMNKTVVVEVVRRTPHPLYKKLIKLSSKFKADNTGFENLEVGTKVKIVETRPISKQKNFKILSVVGAKETKKSNTKSEVLESEVKVEKSVVKKTVKKSAKAKKENK